MRLYLNKGSREALKTMWTPRIGVTASRYYVAARFCAAITPTLGLIYFVIVFTGLRPISFVVLGIGISVMVGTFVLLCLAWNATNRSLGVGFGPSNFPPSNVIAYERWCGERNIVPYHAGPAH